MTVALSDWCFAIVRYAMTLVLMSTFSSRCFDDIYLSALSLLPRQLYTFYCFQNGLCHVEPLSKGMIAHDKAIHYKYYERDPIKSNIVVLETFLLCLSTVRVLQTCPANVLLL